jgi:phosphoribosylformylglycinamidine synthase
MGSPRVLILRAPGTNCDRETAFAFEQAGATPERVHWNRLREQPGLLDQYQILVLPGGFSFGDDVAAGKILAVQLRIFLFDHLARFRDQGKLILGVCNGFQVLLKTGLLVPARDNGTIPATLAANTSGVYCDRWVKVQATLPNRCPFLTDYEHPWAVPVAHGEGRFVCDNHDTLMALDRAGLLVLRYARTADDAGYNPNGSALDVAGMCDATGRVFGLMPHPERHLLPEQHPHWTRRGLTRHGDGFRLFHNAVQFVR